MTIWMVEDVIKMMDRHLLQMIKFWACLWPYVKTVAEQIDTFQARLLAPLLDIRPTAGEYVYIDAAGVQTRSRKPMVAGLLLWRRLV